MSGDEGIEVVFNPDTEQFRLANAATKRNSNWYRVSDILDDELYRHMRRDLGDARGDAREAKFERLRKILNYEVRPY